MRATLFGVVGFVAFAGVVAVLWQGGRLVLEGALTPGALVSFLLYAITVAAAVGSLASLFGSYQEARRRGAARVRAARDARRPSPSRERPVAARAAGARRRRARARRSSATRPTCRTCCSDVSFTIAPGEVVALVGPSGAGKTTIASLLPRFWDVTGGRITLDGIDVRDLSFADLRGAIGIVPQEPALFSGTIRENIAYARLGSRRTDECSSDDGPRRGPRRHAMEFIDRLPRARHARRRARREALRRPASADRDRAGVPKNPAVVVLDEATSSLDNESERSSRRRWRSCCAVGRR